LTTLYLRGFERVYIVAILKSAQNARSQSGVGSRKVPSGTFPPWCFSVTSQWGNGIKNREIIKCIKYNIRNLRVNKTHENTTKD
jgi:hypothetical protein